MICLKQRGQMVDKTGTVDTAMIIQLVVKGSLTIKRKETDISLTLLSIDNSIKIRKTKMKIDFQTAPNRSLLKVKKIKKKYHFREHYFLLLCCHYPTLVFIHSVLHSVCHIKGFSYNFIAICDLYNLWNITRN